MKKLTDQQKNQKNEVGKAKPQFNLKTGKIDGNRKGFAFCKLEPKESADVFVPQRKLNGALHGDEVVIKLLGSKDDFFGEVVKITKRANKTIVGTFTTKNNRDGFVVPDNSKISAEVFVLFKNALGAKNNQRVVVEVDFSKTTKLMGKVIEVLGESSDVYSLELGIIREHKLYEEFSQAVIAEAEKVCVPILSAQLNGRKDLRNLNIFTIDGADAKDLDDAVSLQFKNKNFYLGVHIADVGNYVKYNSVIDKEAFLRGTSAYFPNMVLPMLPRSLSNGMCSLNAGEDRLALSVFMEIDENGEVKNTEICESVINSKARLTYDEVYDAILGKPTNISDEICQSLQSMNELSKILENRRKNAGMLDFDIAESEICVNENLDVQFLTKRARNDAHKLIENFMVICNETVAKFFCTKGLPFVYRVHEKPLVEKIKDFCLFLNGLGISTKEVKDINPIYVQDLLKLASGKKYEEIVNKVLLRCLQKARYEDVCKGHFGLALVYYCHFTSPIRRYPDLTIHRIIKDYLHGALTSKRILLTKDFVKESSFRSSECEKNADEAERSVDDLFKAVYMKDHVGEEFDGVISGVTSYGFYVELENTVEGLVKIDSLPNDSYLYFEKSLMLKGSSTTFTIGDSVRVKCTNSNIFDRKIDFVLV